MFGKFKTKKGCVLLIDEESGIEEIMRRVRLMKFRRKMPINVFSQNGMKVDNPGDLKAIIELVKEKEIKLVIFDPFVAIHSKIENSAEEMQRVMEALQKITLAGATVVFAHHHRKELESERTNPSQSLRGSSALWGRADSHLEVKKGKENQTETIVIIRQLKLREGKAIPPFQIRMGEVNREVVFEFIGEHDEKKIKAGEEKKQVLDALKELGKGGVDELYKKLDGAIGKNHLGEILKELKSEGKINSKKVEHGKEIFWVKGDA
jgi:RecA-family ATPase